LCRNKRPVYLKMHPPAKADGTPLVAHLLLATRLRGGERTVVRRASVMVILLCAAFVLMSAPVLAIEGGDVHLRALQAMC